LVCGIGRGHRPNGKSRKKRAEADRVYEKLIQLVEGPETIDLPDVLSLPEEVIDKYWDAWILWRATGRRVDFENAATRFPVATWDVIFLLDSLLEKITAQKAVKEKDASN
jgi:hypothetical protein